VEKKASLAKQILMWHSFSHQDDGQSDPNGKEVLYDHQSGWLFEHMVEDGILKFGAVIDQLHLHSENIVCKTETQLVRSSSFLVSFH